LNEVECNVWSTVNLGDITNIKTGKLDSNFAEANGEYPFFTCAPKPLRINSYSFDNEAILLAGNNADGIFHINYYKGKFNAYQRTYVITTKDESNANLSYLFYHLQLSLNLMRNLSQGTSTKFLTMKILENLQIALPSIEKQRKISKILSDIDRKIDENYHMNYSLEAIGMALFKRWFVDFEFPNQEGKPYKSTGGKMAESELGYIPEGWTVSSFGNALSLLKDGTHTPPKQRAPSGIRFIAGASDIKHFEIDFTGCTFITESDYKSIHKYWELAKNDVLLTIVGTVGNVAIVKENDLPFSLQRSIAILRAGKAISYIYLYFLLNSSNFKRFLLSRINQTAQPGIYLGTLSSFEFVLPPKELMIKFTQIIEPLILKMMNNNENSNAK
jgi:type I restriction enzyme, S subunit